MQVQNVTRSMCSYVNLRSDPRRSNYGVLLFSVVARSQSDNELIISILQQCLSEFLTQKLRMHILVDLKPENIMIDERGRSVKLVVSYVLNHFDLQLAYSCGPSNAK